MQTRENVKGMGSVSRTGLESVCVSVTEGEERRRMYALLLITPD